MKKDVRISCDLLERFITSALTKIGVPRKDARICADVIVTADKRGIESHGSARLKQFYFDRVVSGIQSAVTKIEVVRNFKSTAVVDGNNGMGMVIAKKSMDLAIKKAKKYGMGMVAVRNSTHYGIAGYYSIMAAKEGMIGITGTNARPSMAPTFGVENMLGTNPLSIGLPTDEEYPFVIDAATSLAQRGKVEVYARAGKKLPKGWVIDKNGETHTNARKVLDGLAIGTAALTPLGGIGEETAGYKGYGYATAVEILSAALSQGSYLKMLLGIEGGKKVPIRVGHFFIAIDVRAFCDRREFEKTTGEILRTLRASKKMPGQRKIYTAGEKSYLSELEAVKNGIPVTPVLQRELLEIKKHTGLTQFKFPF